MALSFPGGLKWNHLMVLVKKFIQFVLQADNFLVLFLFIEPELFLKGEVFGIWNFGLVLWVLLVFNVLLKGLFFLDKLFDLFVHFLFFKLVEIYTINSIDHNLFVPMIIFDNLDNFLLLRRTNDGKYFPNNHFDQGRIVLNQLIFKLMLVQWSRFCRFLRLIKLVLMLHNWLSHGSFIL